jgi:hypothetical protein
MTQIHATTPAGGDPYVITGPSSDGTEPAGDATAYLTPDALMAYCQSRLGSIDAQIRTAMESQKHVVADISQIQAALEAFQPHSSGTSSADDCKAMEVALHDAIEHIKSTDPNCQELGKLEQTYNDLVWSGTGPTQDTPYEDKDTHSPTKNGPEGDHTLIAQEMTGFINALQGSVTNLNSGAELQMIQIQSFMSQRQTAVQITTNLVQSLDDQMNKIASNIGH